MAEQTNNWDNKELGVLWKRKSAKGESFLTGKLNLKTQGFDKDVQVVIFTNKQKKNENHPDLRVYLSEPRQPAGAAPAPAAPKKKVAAAPVEAAVSPTDDELI